MLANHSVATPSPRRASARGLERSVRLHLGNGLLGLRAGASWTPGVQFHDVRFLQRVVIVTDLRWVRRSTRLLAPVLPCPLRVFGGSQWSTALEWLRTPNRSHVSCRMVGDSGVCVVEPHAPLGVQDVDAVDDAAAPWIESHGALNGLVFRMRDMRAWQNLGALVRHVRFAQDHRGQVRRMAVVTDGARLDLLLQTFGDLMRARVRSFPYAELAEAIAWASGTASVQRM